MPVDLKIIGDEVVNKRLGGLKRYIVQTVNNPSATLVSQQALDASLGVAKKIFATPKNKPRYPLRWKSDKQRIAVLIKLKAEGNLPYQRTGGFDRAWTIRVKGKTIEIANEAKNDGKFIAHFLIGDFQQPYHADTGYKKRSESIEKQIIKPITDNLLSTAQHGIEASKNA